MPPVAGSPRVLYVVLAREYSGAETACAPLMLADPDPLLACPPDSGTEAWAKSLGVPTTPLAHREIRSSAGMLAALRGVAGALAAVRDLRRLLRVHPERRIVLGTSLRPSALASLATIGLRGRRVVWTVTDLVRPAALGVGFRALRRLTRATVITHSRYVADHVARGRATVSPPGVAMSDAPAGERDPTRALIVGHVSPTKRTDLAVEIAALVGAEIPDFRLEIVGRAQYREEDHALEKAIRDRLDRDEEATRHVVLVGHDPEISSRMASAGLLLHCRPDEPFGMVLVEAMAAGLPVVAPAAAGPLEIVVEGETGLLYPPGDARAAARCVVRLVRDPDLARRLGDAGRARARQVYSTQRQVAEVQAVLSALTP